jgi:hypothetical protein
MSEAFKTFKVVCSSAECKNKKSFHKRFPLARPDAPGTGEVVVTCPYCNKKVVITIPRVYIEQDALIRGITSRAVEG